MTIAYWFGALIVFLFFAGLVVSDDQQHHR